MTESVKIPDRLECLAMVEKSSLADQRIARHCMKVAEVALGICTLLNDKNPSLPINLDLVEAGALVHDIARKAPNHAARGSLIMREMGFPAVADVVAAHMDIEVDPGEPINEREIVYFADKLTVNDTLCLNVEGRFKDKMTRFINNPEAVEAIGRRLESFSTIQKKISRILGKDILEAIHDISFEAR